MKLKSLYCIRLLGRNFHNLIAIYQKKATLILFAPKTDNAGDNVGHGTPSFLVHVLLLYDTNEIVTIVLLMGTCF